MSKQHVIEGSVAPGYESVKKIFEANFDRGAEENSQLCVYVGEEKVVDLGKTSIENKMVYGFHNFLMNHMKHVISRLNIFCNCREGEGVVNP